MKRLLMLWSLCCWLALSGCAVTPAVSTVEPPWRDALFQPLSTRPAAADVFALDDPMRDYLDSRIRPQVRAKGARRAIVDALYTEGQLRLEYDSSMTRNAREAFASRTGNCLSLVIMTAAFARELGLEVRFHEVLVDAEVERAGDLFFFIGHVNLSMGSALNPGGMMSTEFGWTTVDFLPGQDLRSQRSVPIDASRIVAMYMNNRAAELLAQGRVDDAYGWLRGAIDEDPRFVAARNTLAVVYRRRGALAEAEQVLMQALALEPDNIHVLGNLVSLLMHQGRLAQAEPHRSRLERLQPVPPMAQFKQGLQAMRQGDYARARRLFEAEVRRAPQYHEFHFWLAQANFRLGDLEAGRHHLEAARDAATSRDQQALYAAKLDRLRAGHLQ